MVVVVAARACVCRPPRLHNEIDLNWAGIYSHMHGLACEVSTVPVGIFCRRGGGNHKGELWMGMGTAV